MYQILNSRNYKKYVKCNDRFLLLEVQIMWKIGIEYASKAKSRLDRAGPRRGSPNEYLLARFWSWWHIILMTWHLKERDTFSIGFKVGDLQISGAHSLSLGFKFG